MIVFVDFGSVHVVWQRLMVLAKVGILPFVQFGLHLHFLEFRLLVVFVPELYFLQYAGL